MYTQGLQNVLRKRTTLAPLELTAGQSLKDVLNRCLLAVESAADTILLTSVLLLDANGKRLWHAAGRSLPQEYCEAIDGSEIGPHAGSCGTAAFRGRPVFVTDIATDALWTDYKHLALPHGLRACWSVPIRDHQHTLLGTFAVYHLGARSPTLGEVEAISCIAHHVAQAISWSREIEAREGMHRGMAVTHATLPIPSNANEITVDVETFESGDILRSIEADFQTLGHLIERAIESFPDANPLGLRRAKQAAKRGAALARRASDLGESLP